MTQYPTLRNTPAYHMCLKPFWDYVCGTECSYHNYCLVTQNSPLRNTPACHMCLKPYVGLLCGTECSWQNYYFVTQNLPLRTLACHLCLKPYGRHRSQIIPCHTASRLKITLACQQLCNCISNRQVDRNIVGISQRSCPLRL